MQVDDSFIKGLKNAVRPEYLINDGIWNEWHDALVSTAFFEQNINDFARSKQMFWPPPMHKETFGYFLNMKFTDVKNLIGNDSKRTLIFCIAEKMKTLNTEDGQIVIIEDDVPVSIEIQKADRNDNVSQAINNDDDLLFCNSKSVPLKDLVRVLSENTDNKHQTIGVLNDSVASIAEEKQLLNARCEKAEKQLAEQKRLFAELTRFSQDQQIDIEVLRRENSLLKAEFEMFKEGYWALKSVYDKLLSEKQDALQKGTNDRSESRTIKTEGSVQRKTVLNTVSKRHNYNRAQEKQEGATDGATYTPFDFGDDIKI